MADIDNLKGGTKQVVEESSLDNLRGGTKRVIQVNSLDNLRGGTKRVYVVGGGGGSPVIDPLNVTPSTSAQTITASGGVDGYSPVNVSAVDSSIDANITAANIKKDVSILGVTGTYEGTTPTGTMYIISNGTYNVADKAIANVNVPTTAPALYREFQIGSGGILEANTTTTHIMSFTGVKVIGSQALAYAYFNNSGITGAVDMSGVWSIYQYGCYAAFKNCTGITSIDLSGFTTDSNYSCNGMFDGCTGLTSANLSSLERIISINSCYEMFKNTGLTNINLASLTTVGGNYSCSGMFSGCTQLVSVNLSSLTNLSGANACANMFANCGLTSLSFPSITPTSFGTRTNQFGGMCGGISNITLHFPSNTQAKIETLTGYSTTAPFGATSGTVLFDLPATYTLTGADSVTYTRNPKYDTATALAWKVGAYGTTDFTPAYYTSGTTDPQANDTIYSDSACTTAVTTISSIA